MGGLIKPSPTFFIGGVNLTKNTDKSKKVKTKTKRKRKKKREVIGIHRCRCGNWVSTDDNKIINVVIRHGNVCCKICKANILVSISGGRHAHPKEDKRAGRLISQYYKEDHPDEEEDY